MPNEIAWRHNNRNRDMYFTIRNLSHEYWNSGVPVFETFTDINGWTNYSIGMVESPPSGYFYVGNWPSGFPHQDFYWVDIFEKFSTNPNVSDDLYGTLVGYWNGTKLTLSLTPVIVDANVVQVSGEYVHIEDFKGTSSGGGATVEQIWEYADRSLTEAVSVSGIVDANIVQVSGFPVNIITVFDANIIQVSGEYVHIDDFGVPVSMSGGSTAKEVWEYGARNLTDIVDANVVQISGKIVNIDSDSVADSDELSVLGNLIIRNSRIIQVLP